MRDYIYKLKPDGVGPEDKRPSTIKFHMWHLKYDKWHVTFDTCDTGPVGAGEPSLKMSVP